VKYLLADARKDAEESQLVAGFFFNGRGAHLERSLEGMMRSIMVQLLPQFPAAFPMVLDLYRSKILSRESGPFWSPVRWSLSDLHKAFVSIIDTITRTKRIALFIDALDECDGSIFDKIEFLETIIDQSHSSITSVRICVSSRPQGATFRNPQFGWTLQLEQYTANDIATYIEARTACLERIDELHDVADTLRKELIRKANGVFLWVNLVTEELRRGIATGNSVTEFKSILSSPPSGLHDLYRHMLGKVEEKYKPEMWKMFNVVLSATRPLTMTEFQYILAFERTPSFLSQQEMRDSPSVVHNDKLMENRVLHRSGGLLEIAARGHLSFSTVRFIHQSVTDFVRGQTQNDVDGHWQLLKSCAHYLSMTEIRYIRTVLQAGNRWDLVDELHDTFQNYPLLEYATKNWTAHWNAIDTTQTGPNEHLDKLVEQIDLQSWIMVYNVCNDQYIQHQIGSSLLTIAIESGICGYVRPRRQELDLTALNGRCGSPLAAACAAGDLPMAKLLIGFGADINQQGGPRDNALLTACMMGHAHMVGPLVNMGADINTQGTLYGTALHAAARNGDEEVTGPLLQCGPNIDITHGTEGSALHIAASRGFESVVKMLVDAGGNPELRDGDGWSPSACARLYQHHSTTKLLTTNSSDASSFNHPVGVPPAKLKIIGQGADIVLSENCLTVSSGIIF
jgi:hypothetical protein